jgi:uncharacterized protein (TIGR00369 family)
LEFDPEHGTSRMEFQGKPEFCTPIGTVQGGILTVMLDIATGNAVTATLEPQQAFATLEIKVSFIRPARSGPLIGEGRIIQKGRSICFVEGRLTDTDGNLIATATATERIITV